MKKVEETLRRLIPHKTVNRMNFLCSPGLTHTCFTGGNASLVMLTASQNGNEVLAA